MTTCARLCARGPFPQCERVNPCATPSSQMVSNPSMFLLVPSILATATNCGQLFGFVTAHMRYQPKSTGGAGTRRSVQPKMSLGHRKPGLSQDLKAWHRCRARNAGTASSTPKFAPPAPPENSAIGTATLAFAGALTSSARRPCDPSYPTECHGPG